MAAFSNLVALILLAVKRYTKLPANALLAIFLLGMGFALGMLYLIYTKTILQLPWLYRLPSALYYAMFPAVYLYAKMMVKDQRKMTLWDWLHFLPALLHLIEMMPYYLLPTAEKVQHIRESLMNPIGGFEHNEGWLADYYHNIIRGLMGVIYGVLALTIGWRVPLIRTKDYVLYPKQILWIKVLGITTAVFGLQLFTALQFGNEDFFNKQFLGLMSISQLISAYFLIANSQVMYGMPIAKAAGRIAKNKSARPIPENLAGPEPGDVSNSEETGHNRELKKDSRQENQLEKGPIQYAELKQNLLSFMENEKPFLQHRYSVGELARDMEVPQYHITYLLSQVLHVRFNDFINQYRIQYLKENVSVEDFATHTLEALAQQAGFNSRVTFIRAVQKQTGLNPSEYFQNSNGKKDD